MNSLHNGSPKGKWEEVSPRRPCPVCGKKKWCSVSSDGNVVACRGTDSPGIHPDYPHSRQKRDKNGDPFTLYSRTSFGTQWEPPRYSLADGGGRLAPPDILNKVYLALLRYSSVDVIRLCPLLDRSQVVA
jgi:hypothetical protein